MGGGIPVAIHGKVILFPLVNVLFCIDCIDAGTVIEEVKDALLCLGSKHKLTNSR